MNWLMALVESSKMQNIENRLILNLSQENRLEHAHLPVALMT